MNEKSIEKTINKHADDLNLTATFENKTHHKDYDSKRYWWFRDDIGEKNLISPESGLSDEEALNWLQKRLDMHDYRERCLGTGTYYYDLIDYVPNELELAQEDISELHDIIDTWSNVWAQGNGEFTHDIEISKIVNEWLDETTKMRLFRRTRGLSFLPGVDMEFFIKTGKWVSSPDEPPLIEENVKNPDDSSPASLKQKEM